MGKDIFNKLVNGKGYIYLLKKLYSFFLQSYRDDMAEERERVSALIEDKFNLLKETLKEEDMVNPYNLYSL